MSFYRPIERARYGDEIVQSLSPISRHVFEYLCCNEQDDLCGVYRLSVAKAHEDLGWSVDEISKALSELSGSGLVEWDEKVRVVWVRNMFVKACGGRIGAKHVAHAERQIKTLPRSPIKERFVAYYAKRYEVQIGWTDLSYRVSEPIQDRGGVPNHSDSVSLSVSSSVSSSDRDDDEISEPPSDPAPPIVPTREQVDQDARAGLYRLTEALSFGLSDGTPPPKPPQGQRQLTPAAGLLVGARAGEQGLLHDLLRRPGSTPESVVVEILDLLERWARKIDRGGAKPDTWRPGVLLSPNGYPRCLAELGDHSVSPTERAKRDRDSERERRRAEDEQRSRRERDAAEAEEIASPLLQKFGGGS